MNDVMKLAYGIKEQVVADRRYLHQNPELSFQEYNTADYICARLDKLGIPYKKGIAQTGILAEISNGDGKCLLIRADMDALPLQEKNNVSYASQAKEIMHACGHDAHTAILLNTCELLWKNRELFKGTVKFVFQPGEETTGGAQPMISTGILKNPDVDGCIALHMDSDIPTGKIRIKSGPMYASPDDFAITIIGKGGHGAEPHHAVDPIVVAAHIITQLQTIISRNVDPFQEAVITIGSIHAGHATNIIPDTAKLLGTARTLTNEMREFVSEKIQNVVKSVCQCYGADYKYEFIKLFPPLINDDKISDLILESGKRCIGENNCITGGLPTMAGEDFAYFSQEVPSALFKLGCRNEEKGIVYPIHNPQFDIDEESLPIGVGIFTDFALSFLNS